MRYLRIVTAFSGAYWAIQEHKWNEIRAFLRFKAAGGIMTEDEVLAKIGAKVDRRETKGAAVAVVPIYGIVAQRVNMMDDISGPGSASTERIAKDIRGAISDPAVSAILLDIDSPGGTVFGVTELAKEIYGLRGQKSIVAIANSLAASAAYWIASAASEFHITPSGEAGSIGVFAEHTDMSKWLENEGIKPTLIHAGEFKTEGNQYEPLTDQAAAYIQSRVDDYYGMFVKAVAKYRGVSETKVQRDFGKGRVFGAEQAVASGMADKISTFDQVLSKLTGSKASGKSAQISGIEMEAAESGDQMIESAVPEELAEPDKEIVSGPAAKVGDPLEIERIRNEFEL
jgi:capsid assembly protease